MSQALMRHLTAFELQANAHLVSTSEEADSVVYFCVEVMSVNTAGQLNFLYFHSRLLFLSVLFLLVALVTVLAVIHSAANGRSCLGGDKNQVYTVVECIAASLTQRHNAKLIATLQNAYKATKEKAKRGSAKPAPATENRVEMYWGESAEMKRIRKVVEHVATTDANILITGENGTGKEMMAREIHRLSARCRKTMVSLDMGAIPETLFESELFGHKKGAFTDAHTDREGKFLTASGSTLFMDEIGNLPLHLQVKMLSALQNRAITPLGMNEVQPIDIRLISATNRDLHDAVAKGEFRQDLLFRINTIQIHIPPLRSRKEDIVPLAERFIEHYGKKYNKVGLLLQGEAADKLIAHSWEGNIRELQNAIEKAVIMCDSDMIAPDHIELHAATRPVTEAQTLEEMERQLIANTIEQCGGNLSQVAQQLDITRQTLYNKIKRYGL